MILRRKKKNVLIEACIVICMNFISPEDIAEDCKREKEGKKEAQEVHASTAKDFHSNKRASRATKLRIEAHLARL